MVSTRNLKLDLENEFYFDQFNKSIANNQSKAKMKKNAYMDKYD